MNTQRNLLNPVRNSQSTTVRCVVSPVTPLQNGILLGSEVNKVAFCNGVTG
jgi:hypothetical protein